MKKLFVSLLAMVVVVALFASGQAAFAEHPGEGGRAFTTTLLGANEVNAQGVPNQGDLTGNGTAELRLNPGQGEVCFELTVTDIEPATAAHIHVAPSVTTGPVVVPLTAPTSGSASGCVEVEQELILAIMHNPENYYVNVHNAAFPAGALRGQLSE